MVFLPNDRGTLKVGVSAGRGVGNAVRRNRAKRLIRHAVLPYLASIPVGWDIIFIARESIAGATFRQVRQALHALLYRSGLMTEKNEFDQG
jgi:ribonuclease P protein component